MSALPQGPGGSGDQQVYYVQRRQPATPVTWVLIGLNLAMFVGQILHPPLTDALALDSSRTGREPWRILTSGFIHYGVFHIGFNMFALAVMGRPLESLFGGWRYLTLYLISLVGGSAVGLLVDAQLNRYSIGAGASGAIYGLFGAMLVLMAYGVLRSPSLLAIVLLNLVISFTLPGISWQAHVGGLLFGAGAAWALVRGIRRQTSPRMAVVEVLAVAALAIGTAVASLLALS